MVLVTLAFACGALTLLQAVPATAAEALTLSRTATGDVLLGGEATIDVVARNAGDEAEYNLTFREVLPVGVEYVAGSTRPAGLGEPRVVTSEGRQTLLWRNVSDLPVGAEQPLQLRVRPQAEAWPVGASFAGTTEVYASRDPRTVPAFTSAGVYRSGATVQVQSPPSSTRVSALRVEKSEPSPEHELLRGVHEHPTTYEIEVTANGAHAVSDVVLVDHLPAQLELLGCGAVDNTPDGAVEYDGAPRLDATPPVPGCREPVSVRTVTDPAPPLSGVFTEVRWELGTLAAGEVVRVRYAAGIPQRANTVTFPDGAPSSGSLGQAANLANNTGPSTRETTQEQPLRNRAVVGGTYTGPIAEGVESTVTAADDLTVTAEDVAVQKSASTGTFEQRGAVTYTLRVRASEYADAEDVVLTDVIPNGLCPLGVAGANYTDEALEECTGTADSAPTHPFDSVVENADGTFTVTLAPLTMAASDVVTVTYRARMLETYRDSGDADPTVVGDAFRNTVSLTARTTPPAGVGATDGGPEVVEDGSSATLTSSTVTLDKRVQPRSTGATCSGTPTDYVAQLPEEAAPFPEGSRVCFLVEVRFPTGTETKDAVLADFLPDGVEYEPGSIAPLDGNNVAATVDEETLTFTLGAERGDHRFVARGATFRYRLSGIVTDSSSTTTPDVTGNLAKLQWTNTLGEVGFLRDQVDFAVAPPPPVTVTKAADRVAATPPGTTGPIPDGATAAASRLRGGDRVEFTVTVGNGGTEEQGTLRDIVGAEVWDRLPGGVTCAQVTVPPSYAGGCTDPGEEDHPAFTDSSVRSLVRWTVPPTEPLVAGDELELTYRVDYPQTLSVSRGYRNDVDVVAYGSRSETDPDEVLVHHPADNPDPSVEEADVDAPAAHDAHTLRTPDAAVAKSNATQVDDGTQGTGTAHFAAIGETVTYTVIATIPAGTTVHDGVLRDAPPSGVRVDGVAYEHRSSPTGTWGPLPAGYTGAPGVPASPSVTIEDATAGAEDDQVRMVVTATLTSGTHTNTRTNTATLTARDDLGSTLANRTASSTVSVVEPAAALTKSVDVATPTAGQDVTFTLTARNAAGNRAQVRSPLYDAVVVDCIPAGVTVDVGALPAGAVLEPVGTRGCATGRTPLVWTVGDVAWRSSAAEATDPFPALNYVARIDPSAAGGASYTNTATLTGTSMPGVDPDERLYSQTATRSVTVPTSTISKTVAPTSVPVGDTAAFTVTTELPAGVNFYDATLVDTLPAGISPASVALTGSTCQNADTTPCGVEAAGGNALTADGQRHGWFLGDVPSDPQLRRLTVTYTAEVAVVAGNARGTQLPNRAVLRWNLVDRVASGDRPSTGSSFDRQTVEATATLTVAEPQLALTKTRSNATPVPGEDFAYTVRIQNGTGSVVSPAHDVDVTDTVPAGVRVLPGSISGGGTLSGGATGGGTITWTGLGPLAPGDSVTLAYTARLVSPAPSTAQTNTARVARHSSLPAARGSGRVYTNTPWGSATVTPGLPRLTVAKTALDTPSYVADPTRWRMTVRNTGPARAYDVALVDDLPSGWSYDAGSARVSVAGGPLAAAPPTIDGRRLTWDDLGDLATNQQLVVELTATPTTALLPDRVGAAVVHPNTATATAQDLPGAEGAVVTTQSSTANASIHAADLALTKTAGPAVAGSPITWTLTARNTGPNPAVGPFRITDTVPGVVGGVTASGTGWSCSVSGTSPAEVTCDRSAAPSLAVGAALPPVTVTGTIPADAAPGTELRNTAALTGRTHDPDQTDDEATLTVATTAVADLGIDKGLTGALVPGTPATYRIEVRNHGPSAARGPVTVSDELPAVLSFTSYDGEGWRLDRSGRQLTFTWDGTTPVPVGTLPAITVTAAVGSEVTGTVSNTAAVSEPTDPSSGAEQADSATVATVAAPSADLALSKASPEELLAGESADYELTVASLGPSDAAGPVTVTDTLPDQLSYGWVSPASTAEGWACSAAGQRVTCALADGLAAGASSTLRLTVAVDEALTGDVSNTATVNSPTADPHLPNNTDTDDTGVTVEADLRLSKTLETDPVVAGEQAAYRLTVVNDGPATSAGPVTVTDTLPAGLSYVTASGPGWSCGADGREVTCVRAAALPSGDSADVTLVTAVGSGVGTTTLVNTGSVDGPATDPDLTNNTAATTTPVTEDTELVLDKSHTGATPVLAGAETSFRVEVRNTGSSDARGVTVTDLLPVGMSLVEADGEGWSCDREVCVRDRIPAGEAAEPVTVVARVASGVDAGTELTNSATVTTVTPEDDPAGNADAASVAVATAADLELAKEHATGDAVAGTTTRFTLQVRNLGPSDAHGPLTVTDELPVGMQLVSAATPWTCTPEGRTVTCTVPDGLLAGASAPALGLEVLVDADADHGTVANSATVAAATHDPVPANNTDTTDVTVAQVADLSATKTHAGPARIGEELAFVVSVTNEGPSEARSVTLTDPLPAGLEPVSATGEGWRCVIEEGIEGGTVEGTVRCTLAAPLASDTSAAPVTVVTGVTAEAYPRVDNTATVAADTFDPDPDDDRATDRVEVPPLVDLTVAKAHEGSLQVGAQGRYSITVGNEGATADPGPVTVTDPLPTGLRFVSGSGEGWSCTAAESTEDVSCVLEDGLAVGETSTVDLVVDVLPSAYPEVVNTATASSSAKDADTGDNTATDIAPVVPDIGLALDKEAVRVTEEQVTYRITVTGTGANATVAPLEVVDRLPEGLRLAEAEGEGWSCATGPTEAVCVHAEPLPSGASAELVLVTDVASEPGTGLTNRATVTGGGAKARATDTAAVVLPDADDGVGGDGVGGDGVGGDGVGGDGGVLPGTGGPAGWLPLLGLALLAAGALLVRRRTR